MIITVTLNAAIDKSCRLDQLDLAGINRVSGVTARAGGKGNNAARAAHILGAPVLATGLAAGFNGQFITQDLQEAGIQQAYLEVDGESRVNLQVVLGESGLFEVIEPGPVVVRADLQRFSDHFDDLIAQASGGVRYVLASGSLPRGAQPQVYAQLVESCHRHGLRVILDTHDKPLAAGLNAHPFMVTPNRQEAAALWGKPVRGFDEAVEAAHWLVEAGSKWSLVTLDEEGAVAVSKDRSLLVRSPEVEPVNTVGCGDCFAGGLLAALDHGLGMAEALRWGAAAGAANARSLAFGTFSRREVESLLPKARVETL